MFNDERINNETNKIFSKAILYATIISTIYLIVKIIVFGFILSSFISALFIVLTGIVILIIDYTEYKHYNYDERMIHLRMEYYKKASFVFLGMSLLGFAIGIPLQFLFPREVLPMNDLYINLQVLGFIYFVYKFKSKGIYFNYTFIEKEAGYYKHVFKNILKLAILLGLVYGIAFILSAILLLAKTWIVSVLVSILIAFMISILDLSIVYLFISIIERLTYKSLLNGRKHLNSQVVLGVLIVVSTAISFYLRYKLSVLDPTNVTNVALMVTRISKSSQTLSQLGQALLAMLLSNILLQFKDKVKGIGLITLVIIVSTVTALVFNYLPYLEIFSDINNAHKIYLFVNYFNIMMSLISTIGWVFLTIFLIRNNYSKFRLLIPIVMFLFVVFNLQFQDFPDNVKAIFILTQIVFNMIYIVSLVKIKNSEDILLIEE